jgi:hypothetical protein
MKQKLKILSLLLFCSFTFSLLHGQQSISATGGTATGSGGSVTYTIGQITWNMYSGTNGTVLQGVQQPYEISVVTAIENTEDISLECSVYPNPTRGLIKLIIKSFDQKNLKFQLFDLNGVLLQDKKVDSEVTEISLETHPSSVYFLKIINNNQEIKVFKIIKN